METSNQIPSPHRNTQIPITLRIAVIGSRMAVIDLTFVLPLELLNDTPVKTANIKMTLNTTRKKGLSLYKQKLIRYKYRYKIQKHGREKQNHKSQFTKHLSHTVETRKKVDRKDRINTL